MTTLPSLIERVEKATGPDDDPYSERTLADLRLCADIHTAATGEATEPQLKRGGTMADARVPTLGGYFAIPAYTASLDAALALVERLAPHGRVMLERDHEGWAWAMVQITVHSSRVMAEAQTQPIALILALLRALQSKES